MDMTTRSKVSWLRPAGLGVVAIVMGAGSLTAASSATASSCPDPGSYEPWSDATDGDPGGVSGGTSYPENPIQYNVVFEARDERLKLWDNRTDGRVAEAYLIINSPNGGYVERDILRTGSRRTFELGTPDGSGNIPEGYQVSISLRPAGCAWSENVWLTA